MRSPETVPNRRIVLSDFGGGPDPLPAFREEGAPVRELRDDFVQLKTQYVTVDDHLRANKYSSEDPSLNVGDIIAADGIAEVTSSNHPDFQIDAMVIAPTGWQSQP